MYNYYRTIIVIMRTLSPIRSVSPINKPKVVFNYSPSPIRERPSLSPVNYHHTHTVHTVQIMPQVSGSPACGNCLKKATYCTVKDRRFFCSTCAIPEMSKGAQVIRIDIKDQISRQITSNMRGEKENMPLSGNLSPKIKEFSSSQCKMPTITERQLQLEDFVLKIKKQQQEISAVLEKFSNEDVTAEQIKQLYKNRKLALKQHYQKIKMAVKESIEKDLSELEKRESESLRCVQRKKKDLEEGSERLKQIVLDIQPNRQEILAHVSPLDYQSMISQHKKDTAKVEHLKAAAVSVLNQLSTAQTDSRSCSVLATQQHLTTSHLYDPLSFTLYHGRQSSSEGLFTAENQV